MYITRDKNKQEQRFHVEDFIGVFPAWPIIELLIDNNVSVIEPKTPDDTDAHGAKEQRRSMRSAGDRVDTGSRPLAIGPSAEATPAEGSTVGGPGGK